MSICHSKCCNRLFASPNIVSFILWHCGPFSPSHSSSPSSSSTCLIGHGKLLVYPSRPFFFCCATPILLERLVIASGANTSLLSLLLPPLPLPFSSPCVLPSSPKTYYHCLCWPSRQHQPSPEAHRYSALPLPSQHCIGARSPISCCYCACTIVFW